jgi:hypothetical protein
VFESFESWRRFSLTQLPKVSRTLSIQHLLKIEYSFFSCARLILEARKDREALKQACIMDAADELVCVYAAINLQVV